MFYTPRYGKSTVKIGTKLKRFASKVKLIEKLIKSSEILFVF